MDKLHIRNSVIFVFSLPSIRRRYAVATKITFSKAKTPNPESENSTRIPLFCTIGYDCYVADTKTTVSEAKSANAESEKNLPICRDYLFFSIRSIRKWAFRRRKWPSRKRQISRIPRFSSFRYGRYAVSTKMIFSDAKTDKPGPREISQIPLFSSFRYDRHGAARPSLRKWPFSAERPPSRNPGNIRNFMISPRSIRRRYENESFGIETT